MAYEISQQHDFYNIIIYIAFFSVSYYFSAIIISEPEWGVKCVSSFLFFVESWLHVYAKKNEDFPVTTCNFLLFFPYWKILLMF